MTLYEVKLSDFQSLRLLRYPQRLCEERSDEAIQVQRLPAAAMAEVWGKMDRHGRKRNLL